jgi:hypothetical protein
LGEARPGVLPGRFPGMDAHPRGGSLRRAHLRRPLPHLFQHSRRPGQIPRGLRGGGHPPAADCAQGVARSRPCTRVPRNVRRQRSDAKLDHAQRGARVRLLHRLEPGRDRAVPQCDRAGDEGRDAVPALRAGPHHRSLARRAVLHRELLRAVGRGRMADVVSVGDRVGDDRRQAPSRLPHQVRRVAQRHSVAATRHRVHRFPVTGRIRHLAPVRCA